MSRLKHLFIKYIYIIDKFILKAPLQDLLKNINWKVFNMIHAHFVILIEKVEFG
jgi:hypothetical protein